jgi:hypothetical protein
MTVDITDIGAHGALLAVQDASLLSHLFASSAAAAAELIFVRPLAV